MRREDINFIRKQRHFQVGHEFFRILDILLNLQGFPQLFDLIIFMVMESPPFFIAPVSRNALFRPFMHGTGSNLNFDSFPIGADDCRVQGLIVIGLGHGDIVLESTGNRLP